MSLKIKSVLSIVIILIVVFIVGIIITKQKEPDFKNIKKENPMKIVSDIFTNNGNIPAEYTCDGKATRPSLKIFDVPKEAKTLALIVDDPDAPSGNFVHWIIWNIDPNILIIENDNIPSGATEGYTSLGKPGWVAPCPPSGTHHYSFNLYALNTVLSIPKSSTRANFIDAIGGHIIDSATLTGLYQRSKI